MAAGALLLSAGAVLTYLQVQPATAPMSDLTLANLEAMAFMDPDEGMNPDDGKNIYVYVEYNSDCYVFVGGAYAKGKKVSCLPGREHPICVDCKL